MCRLAFVAFACLALGQASAEALQPAADDPRLNAALAALKPQRPGTVDAYVIVAALDTDRHPVDHAAAAVSRFYA